ncbi:MAG: hypothetical protein IT518_27835, partial [Burkholderiales bacterium]|nr:hypothetical protein [Burkholderiales bacterium]
RPFSVAADEIARGDRILVDDLGVLAVRGEDAIGLEAYRQKRSEFPGRTIYDRVADSREQTLPQAWDAMPVRRPMFYPHAVPGNRNSFRQWPNGDLDIPGHVAWFNRPRSERDSARKDWESDTLKLTFGFPPDDLRGGRELLEGKWPLLRTWWQQGPLFYEFSTIVDTLSAKLDDIPFDEPTVMLAQIRIVNTGEAGEAGATLRLGSGEKGSLVVTGDRVIEQNGEKQRLRYLMKGAETGTLGVDGRATTWSATLKPGESRKLMLVIPSITLTRDEEIEALRKRDGAADVARIVAFWRNLNGGGTLIRTPAPWLNDFYQTHLRHMLVNCFRDADSDALFAHVGTFKYGAFTNESVMMVSDLDRRGHHAEAERCLNGWLRYQGTASLPGNFTTKKGMFYGANRHEMGGYNKHHGYAMWNMAEHWRFTRDRRWMEASAPKLVQACDWVIEQRRTTMVKNADGSRPLEYGWLPAGGLEDVQDYWHWLATNSATVWGFDALAAALADFGHPEAGRLVREAKAYHDDVVAGLTEARILTPVVRLRDGTYVPKFPSRLYERGRSRGWIRETLEGAIFLPVQGIIDPNSIETTWIMKDYEDNLYISNQYGYSISDFERFWFSRGGFSMQAQLLDSPIPYIQRDEPLHYLRTYFNAFASAFEPGIRMCNEHSLPELGMPAGDMFKTSDEAQSTYWLRLIFVHEDGNRLILGQAMPRYWLAQGREASIERAASYFGPLSFRITSDVEHGRIRAIVDPPERNRPQEICVRLRHPDRKGIRSVTVNGKPYTRFDAKKEWVVLPGNIQGRQEIEAQY